MKPILILGLGNLLQGDDGIGCRIAQALEARELPNTVEVLDAGTPGIGLLNLLEGRMRAILVDAAEMNLAPGAWRRFEAQAVTLTGAKERFSLHRTGVVNALALARELNLAVPPIVFFGVQPARVEWSEELSPPVQAALPQVIAAVLQEVTAQPT